MLHLRTSNEFLNEQNSQLFIYIIFVQMIIVYALILVMIIGMMIVWVRSDRSRITVLLPGLNFYNRSQIAWRSRSLGIMVSWLSLVLLILIGFSRYALAGYSNDNTIIYHIISYLQVAPKLIISNWGVIIPRLILQVWVNRGVAHRRGRWLLTGIELTFLWPIFWPLLWCSSHDTNDQTP